MLERDLWREMEHIKEKHVEAVFSGIAEFSKRSRFQIFFPYFQIIDFISD
jgi:hypothetical protein